MRKFLLFFLLFITIEASNGNENNLSKESNTSAEIVAVDENETTPEELSLIEEALKQKKIEEERRLAEEKRQQEVLKEQKRLEEKRLLNERINKLVLEKEGIDKGLTEENIWVTKYLSYETYQNLIAQRRQLNEQIRVYENKKELTKVELNLLKGWGIESKTITSQINQLSVSDSDPFKEYIEPIKLDEVPVISNPLDIITALSYRKHLKTVKEENERKLISLQDAVKKIARKKELLEKLSILSENRTFVRELGTTKNKLKDFQLASAVYKTTVEDYARKVSEIYLNIDKGVENEIKKSIIMGVIIFILLLVFLLVKYLVRKYMSDNDLFYSINKVVNFLFIFIVFLILLFTYLDNVENFMTIISFASAGIAIALKDWFMSVLGWLVILVSGSIHVGDRVRFYKDGIEYVGDIVDISILRMTLHEDVTLTTVMVNKRSGRIVFIPNNYIFTDMIANYSHAGLKTVWDGIEFVVTFDSNIAKAQAITKEVTRQYSKGYTDMTRKQLNRLRSKYSVRNTGVEPRIFTVIEPYGLRITGWYLTNSYATLTLRTTISVEVISRIQKEYDIQLALPSQSLYMNKALPRAPLAEGEEPTENHKPIS